MRPHGEVLQPGKVLLPRADDGEAAQPHVDEGEAVRLHADDGKAVLPHRNVLPPRVVDGRINTINGIFLRFTMAVNARATNVASTAANGDAMYSRAGKQQRGQGKALRPGKVLMPCAGNSKVMRPLTSDSEAAPPHGEVLQPPQYNVARNGKESARDSEDNTARFTNSGNGETICAHDGASLRKGCTKPRNTKKQEPGQMSRHLHAI